MHLSQAAVHGTGTGTAVALGGVDLARVENHRQGVTADQVRTWCANPETQVVVKPVIDLNDHLHVEAYEVPDRLAEQTNLRDHTCVFPWCTRPARTCDSDHVIAHAEGGTTCSCDLAPVCRRHHRLKTHSAWTYTVLEPGAYLWTTPHGYQYLRDHHGTLDVTADRPRTDQPTHPTSSHTAPDPAEPHPGGATGMSMAGREEDFRPSKHKALACGEFRQGRKASSEAPCGEQPLDPPDQRSLSCTWCMPDSLDRLTAVCRDATT